MIEHKATLNPILDLNAPTDGVGGISRQGSEFDTEETFALWADSYYAEPDRLFDCPNNPQTYSEHLISQLGQMADLDTDTYTLCVYLVGCLNSAGYLDISLSELADELSVSKFQLEQSLYIIQQLDPLGSGARNLSECLLLQLADSCNFNELTVHMAQYGLELLSQREYSELAKLLGHNIGEVQDAAKIIYSLNPIPSRGYFSGRFSEYVIPEASISVHGDTVGISINGSALPAVSLDSYYCALAEGDSYPDAKAFLSKNLVEAKSLISDLDYRKNTISAILSCIIAEQQDYFRGKSELKPMTITIIADALDLSTSTVSRAIKDKFVLYNGKALPIRSFFSTAVRSSDVDSFSTAALLKQLQLIVSEEDPYHPFTDSELEKKLRDCGLAISRRTVASKREALKIPPASKRRKH